jgi:hypothetical protein
MIDFREADVLEGKAAQALDCFVGPEPSASQRHNEISNVQFIQG